jgi:hypothetical protein
MLFDTLENILSMTGTALAQMAEQSIERIKQQHDPAKHRARLLEIIEKP